MTGSMLGLIRMSLGRVGWASRLISSQMEYHWHYAGSLCELVFADSPISSVTDFKAVASSTEADNQFNIDLEEGAWHYCFEATDSEGNKTYLETNPETAGRITAYSQISLIANDRGHSQVWVELNSLKLQIDSTSGYIDWVVSGPSRYAFCNAAVFTDANKDPKLSFREEKSQRGR